jgi:hypothetical protein
MDTSKIARWLLGKKRKEPKTKFGRVLQRFRIGIAILVLLYLLLHVFPQPLFGHSRDVNGIRFYSTKVIPESAESIAALINSRVALSEFHRNGDRYTVFLCNSRTMYTLFAPFSRDSFAICSHIGKIFVADGDFDSNKAKAFRPARDQRSLVGVVSHEIAHSMMKKRLGFWKERQTPEWLKEGYCEAIAGESSFPEEEGDRLLAQGKEANTPYIRYFVFRRMVEYLITEKRLSMKQLASKPPNERGVLEETRLWIRDKKSIRK